MHRAHMGVVRACVCVCVCVQILLSRSGSLMGAMTPQGLANLIWGLARMGVSVPPDWMQLYMEHSYNSLPLMNQQVRFHARKHMLMYGQWDLHTSMHRHLYAAVRCVE